MKKIIISKTQLFKLNEDRVNISTQAKSNTTTDFINAATNPNTVSDVNKAGVAGDVNLVINGPQSSDNQPTQTVNVAPGDTVQNAISNQTNDELVRNGSKVEITGPGFGESRIYSKRMVEEARLANMRKNGKVMTKKEITESLNLV
jgi:hypothetical protein